MNRSEWENRLKRFGPGVRLPGKLSVEGDEDQLRVVLPEGAAQSNMQTDDAAFEPWCIALHLAGARRVVLGWRGALGLDGHSGRFRHRAVRFWRLFRSWFEVEETGARAIWEMLPEASGPAGVARWVLNVASSPREDPSAAGRFVMSASEHELELALVNDPRISSALRSAFDLQTIARQLPVGVFDGAVKGGREIFTGGKSAIDLWGLGANQRLVIFELKNGKNVKVGALSELFLYATLMRELQKGTVRFADAVNAGRSAPFLDIQRTRSVEACILAPKIHPILTGEDGAVLRVLNDALAMAGEPIRFDAVSFDSSGTFRRDAVRREGTALSAT